VSLNDVTPLKTHRKTKTSRELGGGWWVVVAGRRAKGGAAGRGTETTSKWVGTGGTERASSVRVALPAGNLHFSMCV